MQWLEVLGSLFSTITSPIDLLMAWLVQIAVEGLSWILGQIVSVMMLTSSFSTMQVTKDIFFLVNFATGILATGVGSYYIFAQLLNHVTGKDAKNPQQIIGGFFDYGFRSLSMPFFLFLMIELNTAFVKAIVALGLSSKSIEEKFQLSSGDPGKFLQTIGTMYSIKESAVLIGALVAVALLIILVVLFFQLIRRTGDVFFLYVLIPPVALTSLTSDLDMYSSWWRQCISVVGSQAVQVIGIYAGFGAMMEGHGIVGTGILLATISTPGVIKEFAYNSGVSSSLKQIGSTAMLGMMR